MLNRPWTSERTDPVACNSQGKDAELTTLWIQSLIWKVGLVDSKKIWSMKESIQMNEQKN